MKIKRLRKSIVGKWKELEHDYEVQHHHSFVESLKIIQERIQEKETIRVEEIFKILSGRGYPALLIVLALPFCLPVQIPGFSTPFGFVLMFIGIRMAFGQKPWWPQWMLKKELASAVVDKVVSKTLVFFLKIQKILRQRLPFLLWDPFRNVHGFVVLTFATLLSLPLVLPFTNFFAALPIVFFGVGLLEDDGLVILMGYLMACISIAFFFGLIWFGNTMLALL